MKLCKTWFDMFEDSALEDHQDALPVDEEGSGSSDEGDKGRDKSSVNVSNAQSSEKRKSSTQKRKGKKKNVSARELSFSVNRANSAAEDVVA